MNLNCGCDSDGSFLMFISLEQQGVEKQSEGGGFGCQEERPRVKGWVVVQLWV